MSGSKAIGESWWRSKMLLRARLDSGVEGLVSYRRVELVERVQEGLHDIDSVSVSKAKGSLGGKRDGLRHTLT